jgi:malonate transporter and related proteins
MLTTFGALAPVFLLIALGWLLRARNFPGDAFWPGAERLVYWILFPALLLLTTAGSDLTGFRTLPITLALVAAVLLTAALTFALRGRLGLDGASFTSVFQGAIRNNTYVGLAGAGALYGEAGLEVMGILVFVVVTLVNVLSVIVLLSHRGRAMGVGDLLVSVAKNPLILACVGGFVLNATGLGLFGLATAMLDILGSAALTLGLLCVGAGLEPGRLGRNPPAVVATSILKLVIMPVATWAFCRLFGVEGVTAATALLFTAAPVSASSYVLARQLGGDAPLMASLITITTILAAVTMPLALALLT